MELITDRLIIRPWRHTDRAAFSGINADPIVRRYYYPALLSRAESDAIIEACRTHLDRHGFGFLAVEQKADGALVGGAGLSHVTDQPFGAAVEIGWILGAPFHRLGYGRETGRAWLAYASEIGLPEVVGFTSKVNHPSRSLMASLGMMCDHHEDFLDPTVPEDHELAPHVLYRLKTPHRRT